MLRKVQYMTLVISTDREFRNRAVALMNNIAFNAQKHFANTIDEGLGLIKLHPALVNIVVDGATLGGLTGVQQEWSRLVQWGTHPPTMVLVQMAKPEEEKTLQAKAKDTPGLTFRSGTLNKVAFVQVFHNRGGAGSGMGDLAGGSVKPAFAGVAKIIQPTGQKTPGPAAPASASAPALKSSRLVAFEASGHVRATLSALNGLQQNAAQAELLELVGQRFNGFVGTFAFFEDRPVWHSLRDLAIVVDCICRTYPPAEKKPITKPHLELLMACARCSYTILQALREEKPLSKTVLDEAQQLWQRYEKSTDLYHRQEHSQEEIDRMVNNLS